MDWFVDFLNSKSDLILLNPRLDETEKQQIEKYVGAHPLGEHVWVMSSGTESQRGGRYKMVALSKRALLAAAKGVNQFFSIKAGDTIYNTLPNFHVAGLLQLARAHLSGAKFVQAPELVWDADDFIRKIKATDTTVTSLVPTQIYDVVQTRQHAPAPLRCVFAGGGALSDSLFQQARDLGWPLIRTYGMTETSAMIAYKEAYNGTYKDTSSQKWRRLPHLEKWESTTQGKIKFYGASLLTGYLLINENSCEWLDPKQQGWFECDDRGAIDNDELTLLGREAELVKVKGETVSLVEVNDRWQHFCSENQFSPDSVVIALPHARYGAELVLVTEECMQIEQIEQFQKTLLPFQKIQRVFAKTLLPRTELGKIKTAELIRKLQ